MVRGFQRARGELERMEGFSTAYFCLDRGSGKGLSMTLWETEPALEASAERAHQLRSEATQPSGATTDSVTHYEVALTAQAARSATA
jgi:heme-degrading monooxygenase HmoA